MKTTILWDHDGVLVDTEPLFFEATVAVYKGVGVTINKPDYLNNMAKGISTWQKAVELGFSERRIRDLKAKRDELYQSYLQTRVIEIEHVEVVLAELSREYAMAIVTTAKPEDFELIHRNRNIMKYMEFALAKGGYRRSKPAPDPYLAALSRFGVTHSETVVIEDSQRGLASAQAAGLDCVVVRNEFIDSQDLTGATYQVDSLRELPELLRVM